MIKALLTGLSLGVLLAVSIGPIIFAIIKQSLNNGKIGGLLFVAGVSTSDVLLVCFCNFLSGLFNKAVEYQTPIGVCGSIMLLVMGIYTLFFKKVITDNTGAIQEKVFNKKQKVGIFISGFFMNILNPGVFIFWIAASSKLHLDAQDEKFSNQYLFIAYATCLAFVLSTDIAKVVLAEKIRPRLNSKNLNAINKISGIILVVFAVSLCYATLNYKVVGH